MKKLSDYAKERNVVYRTAYNRFNKGLIPNAYKDETGHIVIKEDSPNQNKINKCVIYVRVSNHAAKDNLIRQIDRLKEFSIKNGFIIEKIYSEIASGMNDNRKQLNDLLKNDDYSTLIIENKDRLTRFGFNYIETLLQKNNKKIIVVNKNENDKEDLLKDLTSIIYSFTARIYGLRRSKNKQQIKEFLEQ